MGPVMIAESVDLSLGWWALIAAGGIAMAFVVRWWWTGPILKRLDKQYDALSRIEVAVNGARPHHGLDLVCDGLDQVVEELRRRPPTS